MISKAPRKWSWTFDARWTDFRLNDKPAQHWKYHLYSHRSYLTRRYDSDPPPVDVDTEAKSLAWLDLEVWHSASPLLMIYS